MLYWIWAVKKHFLPGCLSRDILVALQPCYSYFCCPRTWFGKHQNWLFLEINSLKVKHIICGSILVGQKTLTCRSRNVLKRVWIQWSDLQQVLPHSLCLCWGHKQLMQSAQTLDLNSLKCKSEDVEKQEWWAHLSVTWQTLATPSLTEPATLPAADAAWPATIN